MLSSMYPLWSFIISVVIAQAVKPFVAFPKLKRFDWRLFIASGGNPSSHTAGVASLCMAVGLVESFDSTLFAITLAFGLIVSYDAANVRYYSGKNIMLTKQIVHDLKNQNLIKEDKEIYEEPLKDVLGHKWLEVIVGAILGIIIALILFYIRG